MAGPSPSDTRLARQAPALRSPWRARCSSRARNTRRCRCASASARASPSSWSGSASSLRLHAGVVERLLPGGELRLDVGAELLRRRALQLEALPVDLLADLRPRDGGVQLAVEPRHHLGR